MSNRTGPWTNTFWRGETLWASISVAGAEKRFSLYMRKPLRPGDRTVALGRIDAYRRREIAALQFGEERRTWDDVVPEWASWVARQVGPRTAARYAVSLDQVAPMLLGCQLTAIDRKLIGELVAKRQKGGTTNATIRRDLTAISSVLIYAEARGWREGNPALSWFKQLSETRLPIVLPDPAHIERVLAALPGALSALARAAWYTGARQEELVSARRNQFDGARRQLTLIGKGRKLRVIELDDRAYEVFRSLPAAIGSAYLFWHGNGRPYRNVSSRFAGKVAAVARAAPPNTFRPFRFHDLRHLHAVEWLKAGKSIYDLQHRLGHTSMKTTEMYLRHMTVEEDRAARST